MTNFYFTSDLHFFHKNILRFTKRPFASLEEMHLSIVNEWNKVITPTDVVYHLGDLSFLRASADQQPLYTILNQLNGTIYCLKGNHCYGNLLAAYRAAQQSGQLRKGIFFEDTPYREIKLDKRKVILNHYPIVAWNGQHHGTFHLFGHCHNSLKLELGKAMDVGYDALWENHGLMRPISYDEVKAILSEKEKVFYDHHTENK